MLCDDNFWPGNTFAEQLSNAYDDFQAFTQTHKIAHSQKCFTPRLVVKKDGSLMMTAKAYNGRCILEWLHDAMRRAIANRSFSDERTPLAYLCLNAMARVFGIMERGKRFLSPQQAQDFHAAAQTYIDAHIELTRLSCLIGGKPHWIIRPKIHALGHVAKLARLERENPRYVHCFHDEDGMMWLKRISLNAHQNPQKQRRYCIKLSKLRMLSMKWRVAQLNVTSAQRAL